MLVIVIRYKKMSAVVSWRILLLACVPQFDTMHPSKCLGANFNDRNFMYELFRGYCKKGVHICLFAMVRKMYK